MMNFLGYLLILFGVDDRVQWFRMRAARNRWQEEIELVDEELRRLIRSFISMGRAWSMVHRAEKSVANASYAARKNKEYVTLASSAIESLKRLGVSWSSQEVDISSAYLE